MLAVVLVKNVTRGFQGTVDLGSGVSDLGPTTAFCLGFYGRFHPLDSFGSTCVSGSVLGAGERAVEPALNVSSETCERGRGGWGGDDKSSLGKSFLRGAREQRLDSGEGGNRVNTWGKSCLRGGDGEVPRLKCVLAEPEAL